MKKLQLAVIALVLLALGYFAASYFQQPQAQQAPAKLIDKPDVKYMAMERFIISVADDEYARYLVLDLSLGFAPTLQNEMDAETFMPVLRNVLVKNFANMDHGSVRNTFTDVDKVQLNLRSQFNTVLASKSSLELADVLITNVFIQ
ncbi:flagellar basal body-associated FliL family protein [Pseudoalteromonas prydzensis]|uniref:flagellar basal body-associated FliL family protein n=1 Tax=Pseudoalteromonas prydzensis TaxID=182141 RepID=UPI0007E51C2B|nr:flagellar basal body-associated FliL family protein [Pseudoalteromonas prydzensis]